MDNLTREQRHKNMKAIQSKDTSIEIKLRKALWKEGLRYRKNYAGLPGKPDIVFTKYKIAVFCDSDFWHGFDWENRKHAIKSNHEYWIPKIERNMARDRAVGCLLKEMGWEVIRFWEWQIRKEIDACVSEIQRIVLDKKTGSGL